MNFTPEQRKRLRDAKGLIRWALREPSSERVALTWLTVAANYCRDVAEEIREAAKEKA